MNKEIIGLLFGVEGGADVGKGSGKLIVKDLTDIVKKINAGSTSVPKLSLSIDIEETTKSLKAAINEITSALGGGAIKFTGLEKIESSLDAIAGGSERLAKGLVMIFGKLDSILNSMPGDFDLTSKSAVKSIEAITSKVNDLVAGIESLSATVTEISQKPSSIVNNIIGGTSEDLERLSLLKQKAKEIMSAYADTYRVVSSISGTSTLTGAYASRYKSGSRAAEAMNTQAKLFNGAVASSETIEKVKDINLLIQEYGRNINELIDVMEIANSRGANLFVPDYSNYKRASDALKEYDARQKEVTPDSSSPEAKSVLEHAKDISAACTSIEERLDLLRAKIEATFDFSTITPDVTNILTVLDEAKEKVGEIKKKSSQPGGSSDEKGASGFNSKDRLKTIKAYLQALTEVQKSVQKGGVGFDEDSGKFKAINDAYKNRVELVNKLKEEVEKLGVEIDAQSGLVIKPEAEELEGIAKKLGVTKEKFEKFYDDIGKEGLKTAGKVEKSTQSTVNSTSKQVRNARQEVLRMYDTISKDPASKKIANEILKMTKSGVVNLDDLTDAMNRFRTAVAVSGADVETWGQKFKKAFANQVRSALASLITIDLGQILKGVYDNVVALDDAVVNLQIASGKSRTETKALVKEYAALAKQLKATTAEVSASADTWLRQGYSAKEAETLITNSMMLSKLGQIESEEAATALTSAMKGYKVAVEDTVNIVDKLTAVDMEAAASAGGIATAMAETAAGAGLAGVSMDKLIGYLAVVKEVTQDADESVGTFFRTLFSRMGNIKVGKYVDEDGESLNDVETVLGELGIKLRESNDEFRNFSDVLDEVGKKWNDFSEVDKNAVASALAGTKQREKLIVLMDNYGTSLKYAATAAESAGTATQKYEAYTEGVTGSIQELKSAFEEFSLTVLDSDWLIGAIGLASDIVSFASGASKAIDYVGGLNSVLSITAATLIAIKSAKISKWATDLPLKISNITAAFKGMNKAADSAAKKQMRISVGISAISFAISAAITVLNAVRAASDRRVASSLNNSSEILDSLQNERDSLDSLINRYEELYAQHNGTWNADATKTIKDLQEQIANLVGDQAKALDLVNGKLDDEKEKLTENQLILLRGQRADASRAMEESWVAAQEISKRWDFDISADGRFLLQSLNHGTRLAKSYNPLNPFAEQMGNYNYVISEEFNSAEDFVNQYEAVQAVYNDLLDSGDYKIAAGLGDPTDIQNAGKFLDKYKEVYDSYIAGSKELKRIDELISGGDNSTNGTATPNASVVQKSVLEILNDVQPAYDAISEALANLREGGLLTADSLSALLELEQNGKIGGVETAKLITKTADGYHLAADALEQYVNSMIEAEIAATKVDFVTQQDADNAIANLENLIRVLATLAATQDDATNAADAYRDSLEAQKDAQNEALDAYKELIDLRKDLLESYADELEYQRELEKKQQNVASLQTKLAVARLDNSPAGQARVRDLEGQLKEAQEDLDDYTLERAIDDIIDGLDNQYSEYENFVKEELEKIEELLESSSEGTVSLDSETIGRLIEAAKVAIGDVKTVKVEMSAPKYDQKTPLLPGGVFRFDSMIFPEIYHTGGFVGGVPTLANNEEFAKLLEGEFVSTPSQIKNFMTRTLPQLTSFSTSGGYEFHAPLVEIKCESVTSESMPKLKEIVDEAVGEIKRCLDGGMSRTGYKRSVKKLLT